MNHLNNITILITTYNRYPYLLRVLRYYASYGFPARIIVLDSSFDPFPSELREIKELLDHPAVEYRRFDSNTFITNKIYEGMKEVSTPYSVLCADDDFINPNALVPCMTFLENHKDYSCAQGLYVNHFLPSHPGNTFKKFFWSPLYVHAKDIPCGKPSQRLNYYFRHSGISVFYAVYSTELLRLIYKEAARCTCDWDLSETLPLCLCMIHGKVKILPVFYSSREANSFRWVTVENLQEMLSNEKCELVIQCIAEHLQSVEGLNPEEALSIARKNIGQYVKKSFDRFALSQKESSRSALSIAENSVFIKFVKKVFRFLLWRFYTLRYFLVFHFNFYPDLLRMKDCILQANIDEDILNRIRKNYRDVVK